MYNNNYMLIVTEQKGIGRSYIYYFETLEEAERAKKAIEEGGNRAKIKEVRS